MKQEEITEEQVLICEECGKELAFVQFFTKQQDICPVCNSKGSANDCRLLCKECRSNLK
jgi:rubrerythrin